MRQPRSYEVNFSSQSTSGEYDRLLDAAYDRGAADARKGRDRNSKGFVGTAKQMYHAGYNKASKKVAAHA